MSTVKKINPSSSASFNNALHAQFHDTVCKRLIVGVTLEQINIPLSLHDDYQRNIIAEIDLSHAIRTEVETEQLHALDRERDAFVVYFMAAVRTARLSPVAAQQKAGKTLEIPLKPYIGIQEEAFDVETLHIKGLVEDMRKGEYAPSVEALGLEDVINNLGTKNQAYESLKASRTDTRVDTALENSKLVRPRTDACYAEICNLIDASYLLTKEKEVKDKIGECIDKLNEIIAEFKTTAKEMGKKEK